jgi:hypothetical protein
VKWFIRLILLGLVLFAAVRAQEVARHVVCVLSAEGEDGKYQDFKCSTFDSDKCIPNAAIVFDKEGHLLERAWVVDAFNNTAPKYRTWTFLWGAVCLLSFAGIMLSFRKSATPRAEEGDLRLGL